MTVDQAVEKAQRTLRTSYARRAAMESAAALHLTYIYGNGWAKVNPGIRTVGSDGLTRLQPQMRKLDGDIRVSLPKIRPRVVKLHSRLSIRSLAYRVEPASGAANDFMAAQVGDERLRIFLDSNKCIDKFNRASLTRLAIGSSVMRRTMSPNGPGIILRDPAGQPLKSQNGKPKSIRTFHYGWAVCPPFEFCRDPAVNTPDFDDDEIVGHEKPQTTDWVQRHFGVEVETATTMGQLTEFQRCVYQATGGQADFGGGRIESEQPAVIVSEWFLRSGDQNGVGQWPYHMLAYRKYSGDGEDKLQPLTFGPNPYNGLPFHHFWYTEQLMGAWGMGVAAQTIGNQDIANLVLTILLRSFLHQGVPKWALEEGSTQEDPHVALQPRSDRIVVVKRGYQYPKRLETAAVDQCGVLLLNQGETMMDDALNMSPIQRGIASKRGEAGKALELKKGEADSVLTQISETDARRTNELLTGQLLDMQKTEPLGALRNVLSGRFDDRFLLAYKTQDQEHGAIGVRVTEDSLRSKTPAEEREEQIENVTVKLTDAKTARYAMALRQGIVVDPKESAALKQQQGEIAALLAGEEVRVRDGQDHDAHMYVIQLEMESPRWLTYSPEQQDRLQDHHAAHREGKIAAAALEAQAQMAIQQAANPMQQQGGQGYEMTPSAQGQGQGISAPPQAAEGSMGELPAEGPEFAMSGGPQFADEAELVAGPV